MEIIKDVPETDFKEFNSIVQEYLPGTAYAELSEMYKNAESVFAGVYLDGRLIGVCFGEGDMGGFGLVGIAVTDTYDKHGRGGQLLAYFESAVKAKGYTNVSVGSADGYVERFYMKNGYKIESLKVLTDNEDWKTKENPPLPISAVETQGKHTKIVFAGVNYETTDKDKLCAFFNGFERFYVLRKEL
ncbi:hypothetical protein FACS189490_10010 [Clostridia bacterium]|nr:hypothetical protein FACS189490_10010 [Clostridia bacterium]